MMGSTISSTSAAITAPPLNTEPPEPRPSRPGLRSPAWPLGHRRSCDRPSCAVSRPEPIKLTVPACASRARTATTGCSAATRPWCITPPRRGRALWCARSWAGTGRPCGCRTVTSAQQGHADRQQTCLAHLARDVADALEAGDDPVAFRLKLWLGSAFALARGIGSPAAPTINAKRRKLEAALDEILAAPVTCDLARDIQTRMRRARDQVLTFASFPGRGEATNNACERDPRPAGIPRQNTNGYRAMWSAQGEAAVRTVVATARLKAGPSTFGTVLSTITA